MEDKKLFICSCCTTEHQFIVFKEPEDNTVVFSIHLSSKPFLKRVVHALRYIFGYRCEYGDFDEVILNEKQIKELIDYIK